MWQCVGLIPVLCSLLEGRGRSYGTPGSNMGEPAFKARTLPAVLSLQTPCYLLNVGLGGENSGVLGQEETSVPE